MDWVVEHEEPVRAERFLKGVLLHFSTRNIRDLISSGQVTCNGKRFSKGTFFKQGDRIAWPNMPDMRQLPIANKAIEVKILHQDSAIFCVCKPAKLATHPNAPWETNTLANGISAYHPECLGVGRHPLEAGLVNRLDNKTSGIVLVARNQQVFDKLWQQQRQDAIEKQYVAWVKGLLDKPTTINLPLAHHATKEERMVIVDETAAGKKSYRGRLQPATTVVKPIRTSDTKTLVSVTIHRGRRHQIRIHLAHIGHPVIGEDIYIDSSADRSTDDLYLLHASHLFLKHPVTGDRLEITSYPEFYHYFNTL